MTRRDFIARLGLAIGLFGGIEIARAQIASSKFTKQNVLLIGASELGNAVTSALSFFAEIWLDADRYSLNTLSVVRDEEFEPELEYFDGGTRTCPATSLGMLRIDKALQQADCVLRIGNDATDSWGLAMAPDRRLDELAAPAIRRFGKPSSVEKKFSALLGSAGIKRKL